MRWGSGYTTNFLGPFQRIIMDFLILMVSGRPQGSARRESLEKTQVNFVDA